MASDAKKTKFVEAVTKLGGSATNKRLREELHTWREKTYDSVKEGLIEDGLVVKKPGPGGIVVLVDDPDTGADEDGDEVADEVSGDDEEGLSLSAAEPALAILAKWAPSAR